MRYIKTCNEGIVALMYLKNKSYNFYAKAIGITLFIFQYINISLTGPEANNWTIPAMEARFGWNILDVALLNSALSYIGMAAGFFLSTMLIRKGIRKVALPCMFLSGVCYILLANVETTMGYMIIKGLLGIFVGSAGTAQGLYIANWFIHNRGKAIGLITIGMPLSTATFTAIATYTLGTDGSGWVGFHTAIGIALIVVTLMLVAIAPESPEDAGLEEEMKKLTGIPVRPQAEVIEEEEETGFFARLTKRPGGGPPGGGPGGQPRVKPWSVKKIFTSKVIWFSQIGMLIGPMGSGAILMYFIIVLPSAGVTMEMALLLYSASAIVGMPCSYLWGYIDTKIGTANAWLLLLAVDTLGLIFMALGCAVHPGFFVLAAISMAMNVGGGVNLTTSLPIYLYGRDQMVNVARWTGLAIGFVRPLTTLYVPYLLTVFVGSYHIAYLAIIPVQVISALCFFLCRNQTLDPEQRELERVRKAAKLASK